MKRDLTVWAGMLAGVLSCVLVAAPAAAYIPPASFLMEKLATKRNSMGLNRLTVHMQCKDGSGAAREETWYLRVPGQVRRESADSVEICESGKCQHKAGKNRPATQPSWSYLPYLYFVENSTSGSRYLGLLQSLKIDTKRDTIARFHGRLAVVLGAKEWERDRPQFWLDKETFLPLRLMLQEGKALIEIMWLDWGSRVGGDWFPAAVEIKRDGALMERCEILRVDSSLPISDALFLWPAS